MHHVRVRSRGLDAFLYRFALGFAVLVGAAAAQSEGPQERDVWYAHMADGVRYGSHRVQGTTLPDGNFRYQLSVRVLVDVFGSQEQEVLLEGEYIVTPDLRPVSMHTETDQITGKSVLSGQSKGDAFHLGSGPGGEDDPKIAVMPPDETVLFSISIDDWLASLDPALDRAEAKVFDEESGTLTGVVATRTRHDATGSAWSLDAVEGAEENHVVLDPQGLMSEGISSPPKRRIVRCTEQEAAELQHRELVGSEVLSFPLDRQIDAPQRLTHLVVKLNWRDIPLQDFHLEDARQRVVEYTADGADHTVVLEIQAPVASNETNPPPLTKAERVSYLAETTYIKPADEGIVEAARLATAETLTPQDKVTALSQWVFDYIDGKMIAETLSGPEVLECATGKCSEYSTLFASMARSLDLPTRIVLGERIAAGSWGGHMWNEVWIGRWITVDASANEVDHSLQLLKFIHSDSLEGTQPLRWALTESLSIAIEDFTLAESKLAETYTTGIDGRTYTNVDYQAQLTVPTEDWTLTDNSQPGTAVIKVTPPDSDDMAIHFVAFSVPPGTDPEPILAARTAHWKSSFDKLDVLADEAHDVRDAPGRATHLLGHHENGDMVTLKEVLWVQGPVGYLVTMNVKHAASEAGLAACKEVLAGFRVLVE